MPSRWFCLKVRFFHLKSLRFHDQHLVAAVDLCQHDLDPFAARSGQVLALKSGLMGSSRWPRSMNTASCTVAGRPSSKIESMAARMVRPVNSTSSISTMSLSSMLKSISVFFTAGCCFVLVQVVAEHSDVEDAQRDVDPFQFLDQRLDAAGHEHALASGCRSAPGCRLRGCAPEFPWPGAGSVRFIFLSSMILALIFSFCSIGHSFRTGGIIAECGEKGKRLPQEEARTCLSRASAASSLAKSAALPSIRVSRPPPLPESSEKISAENLFRSQEPLPRPIRMYWSPGL